MGFAVGGAAAFLLVTVLLPWVRVTAHVPGHSLTATSNGLGPGQPGALGWVTLVCAAAAAALGTIGGVLSKGKVIVAAAAPTLIALLALLVVGVRLKSNSSRYPVPELTAPTPEMLVYLRNHLDVSLTYGWYLALLAALTTIALSVAALIVHPARPGL